MVLPELDEWDPRSLPGGFFIVLEGKRRTGKSTFAKWLLQYYQNEFSLVWVMSQTALSGYWQKFVGDAFVFDHYDAAAIRRLIERNDKIIAAHGEDSPITKKTASALLILDDCINKEVVYSDEFLKLAVEGRHHHISVLFITQDPKTIQPKVRDNTDVVVIFNLKTKRNKESIWHDYMNDVDRATSEALLAKYCTEHNTLICIQTNLTGELKKNFLKSGGDKTKLEFPDYMLGGPTQKEIIKLEREKKRIADAHRAALDRSDSRPLSQRVESDLAACKYTVSGNPRRSALGADGGF